MICVRLVTLSVSLSLLLPSLLLLLAAIAAVVVAIVAAVIVVIAAAEVIAGLSQHQNARDSEVSSSTNSDGDSINSIRGNIPNIVFWWCPLSSLSLSLLLFLLVSSMRRWHRRCCCLHR